MTSQMSPMPPADLNQFRTEAIEQARFVNRLRDYDVEYAWRNIVDAAT
jgi:hypothetical protein